MENIQINEKPQKSEKIWTKNFTLLVLANFFIFLGFQMTLPTIPLFIEQLGGNDQLIGLVVGIFTFSALIIRPFAGHALESKGRAFVYLTGLVVFVISVGSYAFAMSITFLFMMRIVQGIGWGLSTTASGTIATDSIPANKRGEGMGYYGLSGNLALAFGPSLGLTLSGVLPFQQLFFICAGLGLAAFISSSFIKYKKVAPTEEKEKRKKWDLYEKSALQPSFLIMFITVTFGGIATFLPLYTAQEGITGIQWYFLLYALALMVSRIFAGKLYDKKGHRAVFIPGTSLIVIAMLLLAWLPNNEILFTAAILYGFGFGTVQPALQAWSVKQTPVHRRGMANATFYSFFDIGIGLGAMFFGQISFLFGYKSVYLSAATSVLISILIYLFLLFKGAKRSNEI
ncbi:MFS transporter [Niallia endozanthoxylica]|uniref:MFS transporter n=1 Tax=Niallia endozanthoxylica TaxID=2036016 RepID=A0A5J5HLF4_9BACI|nr:MFS transporter [Niallia endozanthoxylica]KAA9021654.1 MFS transporter [Niallia endozanthoxylica]